MKKRIFIQPRKTSKTNTLIKMFLDDIEIGKNSILVFPNEEIKKLITPFNKVYTVFDDVPIGEKLDSVYIDEAMFCNKEKLCEFYMNLLQNNCLHEESKIISFSTSDILYNKDLIYLTKILKENPSLRRYIDKNILTEIDIYYWKNIITKDFEIIESFKSDVKEKTQTQILGKFFFKED